MRNGRSVKAWLTVRDPGLHTTLQDQGRIGSQRLGVPVAGALDPEALALGNALVGNAPTTAALEILVAGPTLEVETESVRIALAGAGAVIEIVEGEHCGSIPAWHSVTLGRGTVFRVAALPETLCAYIAVGGGFDVAPVLASRSTYARGRIGGFEGRALAAGDRLPLVQAEAGPEDERTLANAPGPNRDQPIRIVLGPQDDMFRPDAIETLVTSPYAVSTNADRMGMRLDGPKLAHVAGFDIVSDGTAPGSIQVPGSGQPIVLLCDRQTTGGYPKLATVVSADLPVLARRRPGDPVRFEAVEVDQAIELRRARQSWLDAAMADLVSIRDPVASLSDTLYNENLISGVTAGADDLVGGTA